MQLNSQLLFRLERTKQERDDYMSEISQERELVVSAKKHAEDLRNKLEM